MTDEELMRAALDEAKIAADLCEGTPPAGGGGENCTAARNISGYGKVLSRRPFGAPPSQGEASKWAMN